MTSTFIPKRPHKKSRGGCKTCKTRKIKCDENAPKCGFCKRRDLECVYLPRSVKHLEEPLSNSWRPIEDSVPQDTDGSDDDNIAFQLTKNPKFTTWSSQGPMSSSDLRLMHLWSTSTWQSLAIAKGTDRALQVSIPQLAFENDFLMNGILAVSCMQQALSSPSEQATKQVSVYRLRAYTAYRQALSRLRPGSSEYEAALIMSLLVVLLCSKDPPPPGELNVVKWFTLYQGLRAVINVSNFDEVLAMDVGPIFQREPTPLKCDPVLPRILLELVKNIQPWDPDFSYLQAYCEMLDALGKLYACLKGESPGTELAARLVSWPSFASEQFAARAAAHEPRALVILAYFLMFLRFIKSLWWVEGLAEKEIPIIAAIIGPDWASYMEVPLRALTMDDEEEIRALILS